jgi:hypothetical protein
MTHSKTLKKITKILQKYKPPNLYMPLVEYLRLGFLDFRGIVKIHSRNSEKSLRTAKVHSAKILWHVGPLLGNDRETSYYTTTIAK